MKALNKKGLLRYNDIPVKTKSGKQIYTDTYLVDKAKFAQCNIRDITESKQAQKQTEELNRSFVGRELKMAELKERIAELEKEKS